MGQQISNCKTGTEPSIGAFEPHITEQRKRRLPGAPPKSLLFQTNDDNEALSRATATTGQSSPNTSISPSSPLNSSSGTLGNGHNLPPAFPDRDTNPQLHQPLPLRYTTSTRNLQTQTPGASATTATTTLPPTHAIHPRVDSYLPPLQHKHSRIQKVNRNHKGPADKRSNPVKFPRKRSNPDQRSDNGHPNGSPCQEVPQDASYLERMYDSRTWEMYRRITTHREKLEAFNAANASAKRETDDDRNSTNRTYMSDPVQRVTNSSTMEGGVDYDNFYDTALEEDSRGNFLLEDHSAPPYHHHRQCDNGQQHHQASAETYSEWEHMYGDDGESGKEATNADHHETIFLFDF